MSTLFGRAGAVLALCLVLVAGRAAAPGPAETFASAALNWWKAVDRYYAQPVPPLPAQKAIAAASLEWGGHFWPDSGLAKAEILFELKTTEGENLNDPSWGMWGVTVPAGRYVEYGIERGWIPGHAGMCFPKGDVKLAALLSGDIRFNGFCAAGYLRLMWRGLPANHETRAVLRFKMGPHGPLNGRDAGIRKRHYWNNRAKFRLVLAETRRGGKQFRDAMR